MRIVDLLRAVRDGDAVPPADLRQFVLDIGSAQVPDYQAAAFLMAVFQRGLSDELTVAMTLAMRDSGRCIEHSVTRPKVDKHSTGGVGDKISIALAPLVAACGVPVPMISGRGLGHTGGTLDKLEAIPGFRVDLGVERFLELVADIGVCLIGQTDDLAPADRKLYALRDVTATVESIPLITASILSKKLAEGIDALVLDVKVGRGAFMKDERSARQLAESLVRVGSGAGLEICALLTRMEEPLGRTIGNALEIREAIEILRGDGPPDTTELTLALGAEMLQLGGVADTAEQARVLLQRALDDGAATEKLRQIIVAQHGDPAVVDDLDRLPRAAAVTDVVADASGIVQGIDAYALGVAAMRMGAGRAAAEDQIDPAVGIELSCRVGDTIDAGQPLARLHHNRDPAARMSDVRAAFTLGAEQPEVGPLVVDRIGR